MRATEFGVAIVMVVYDNAWGGTADAALAIEIWVVSRLHSSHRIEVGQSIGDGGFGGLGFGQAFAGG